MDSIKNTKVLITLSNPLLASESLLNTVNYIVKTEEDKKTYECLRYYKDFASIRKILVKKWPGVYIPCVPSTSLLSNISSKFVKTYKKQLEFFLEYISQTYFLYTAEEFQFFIKHKDSFKRKYNPNYSEISLNYQMIFHDHTRKAIDQNIISTIYQEETFFTTLLNKIVDFKDSCEILTINFKDFHGLLASSSNSLTKIEKLYITSQDSEDIFEVANLANIKNPYNEVFNWAENEIFEIEAFLEAISAVSTLEKMCNKLQLNIQSLNSELEKIDNNKISITKLFSFKPKSKFVEDTNQKVIGKETELENISNLYNIIVLRLVEEEIPKFKSSRSSYFDSTLDSFNSAFLKSLETLHSSCEETNQNTKKVLTSNN